MTAITPAPFITGFRTIDGSALNAAFANPDVASQDSITAFASATQATATQLTTPLNRITTVATAADGVALPPAYVGSEIWVINAAAANAMQVFGNSVTLDTINGIATATGISQPAGTAWLYTCTTLGAWRASAATGVFNELRVLSAAGYGGTFVNNGVTGVTTANANMLPSSIVLISLNTVGGTVGAIPHVETITSGTGFTTIGTASDSSTYNYLIVQTV